MWNLCFQIDWNLGYKFNLARITRYHYDCWIVFSEIGLFHLFFAYYNSPLTACNMVLSVLTTDLYSLIFTHFPVLDHILFQIPTYCVNTVDGISIGNEPRRFSIKTTLNNNASVYKVIVLKLNSVLLLTVFTFTDVRNREGEKEEYLARERESERTGRWREARYEEIKDRPRPGASPHRAWPWPRPCTHHVVLVDTGVDRIPRECQSTGAVYRGVAHHQAEREV